MTCAAPGGLVTVTAQLTCIAEPAAALSGRMAAAGMVGRRWREPEASSLRCGRTEARR